MKRMFICGGMVLLHEHFGGALMGSEAGILLVAVLVLLKYLFLERVLCGTSFKQKRVFLSSVTGSLVSGLVGYIVVPFHFVFWFPWSHSADHYFNQSVILLPFLYSLFLTALVDVVVNLWLLRKLYPLKPIALAVVIGDVSISTIGFFIVYSFALDLLKVI